MQVTNSTSEYLEYWSVTTKAYSPFTNGPQRSSCKIAHGFDGSSVIFAGSVCLVSVATCHSKHLFTAVSMFWKSFNNVFFLKLSQTILHWVVQVGYWVCTIFHQYGYVDLFSVKHSFAIPWCFSVVAPLLICAIKRILVIFVKNVQN